MSAVAVAVFFVYAAAIALTIAFNIYPATLALSLAAPVVGWGAAELESRW